MHHNSGLLTNLCSFYQIENIYYFLIIFQDINIYTISLAIKLNSDSSGELLERLSLFRVAVLESCAEVKVQLKVEVILQLE